MKRARTLILIFVALAGLESHAAGFFGSESFAPIALPACNGGPDFARIGRCLQAQQLGPAYERARIAYLDAWKKFDATKLALQENSALQENLQIAIAGLGRVELALNEDVEGRRILSVLIAQNPGEESLPSLAGLNLRYESREAVGEMLEVFAALSDAQRAKARAGIFAFKMALGAGEPAALHFGLQSVGTFLAQTINEASRQTTSLENSVKQAEADLNNKRTAATAAKNALLAVL